MSLEDQQQPSNWSVECSDEEGYFDSAINYRQLPAGGGRIWEPSGEEIARLYGEMETVGFNRLQWQCPGRISPSQLQTETTDGQFENAEEGNNQGGGAQTKSKFDFDTEFDDEELPSFSTGTSSNSSGNRVTAKRTQGLFTLGGCLFADCNSTFFLGYFPQTTVVKKQTNLSKVMLNIKKYQIIDQKGGSGGGGGGKANAPTTSSTTNSTSTAPVSAGSTFQSSTAVNNGTSTTTTTTTTSTAESEYDEFQ